MFEHVIVGVDGNEGGRDAIALARLLASPDARLALAHVCMGDALRTRGSTSPYGTAERDRGIELLERERAETGIAAQLHVVRSASVGRGLHVLAESSGADLLIVGSCRRGLLGRVMVGDDTRAALNGAPCAVAVAPAGYALEPAMMQEIGVAYNGSPESEHALAIGQRLAAESGARLSAFEAVTLPAYLFLGGTEPVEDSVAQIVERAREKIAALGGVEPHAAYGLPVEELTLYSASLDLLIVGSRDYGPIGRIVHGSTSGDLARTARCPLLILTRAARAADPSGDASGVAGAALSGGL